MTYRAGSSRRPRPANQAALMASLQRHGLTMAGIQQALQGHIVSDPADRAAIARILTALASLPPHAAAELYDYPGEYAQRFDGADGTG
jgi:hypothetical protein